LKVKSFVSLWLRFRRRVPFLGKGKGRGERKREESVSGLTLLVSPQTGSPLCETQDSQNRGEKREKKWGGREEKALGSARQFHGVFGTLSLSSRPSSLRRGRVEKEGEGSLAAPNLT